MSRECARTKKWRNKVMQDYLEDYLEELYDTRELDDMEETEDAFEM
jgi:hypothetical protein